MSSKLLIINQAQFGYHIDTYYYCKYLKDDYDITYICWDYGRPKIRENNVNVKYCSREGSLVKRNIRFIIKTIKEIKSNNYDIIFIQYFRGCSLLKILFRHNKLILDIRTLSVHNLKINRFFYNYFLKLESIPFENITVISDSLRKKLKIPVNKSYILPLGADVISKKNKKFDHIALLYIGTLSGRKIEETVLGFDYFYQKYRFNINISYTIVGDGWGNELEDLKKLVKSKGLNNIVKLPGYIHHNDIKQYFDEHNIGVSYIPKTEYYEVQPPTKTFEYLLSGMPVIATSTVENKKIVDSINGVLIEDNPYNFYKGLVHIYNNLNNFSSERIREESQKYNWKNILSKLKLYLDNL